MTTKFLVTKPKKTMRKLITLLVALFAMQQAYATCTPTFTSAAAPLGSDLLRMAFTNTTVGGSSFTTYFFTYEGGGYDYVSATGTAYHSFSAPGTYRVVLNMYDSSLTGSCSAFDTMYITVAYPECGTIFSSSLVSATSTGVTYTFTPSTPSGTTMTSYSWNFGDGSTSTTVSPTHVYTASGSYVVTLTATNGTCTYTTTDSVYVSLLDCATASATAHMVYSSAPNTYNYYTTSTPPATGYVADYVWNFGDGTSTTDAWGYHTYTTSGVYTATVTLTWRSDSSSTVYVCTSVDTIVVNATTNDINGHIYFSGAPIDSMSGTSVLKIWLIKYTAATTSLSAVDSIVTSPYGPDHYYHFTGAAADTYRVKAAYFPSTFSATSFIPTYGDSSILWSGANAFAHDGVYSTNRNIYMKHGTTVTGPGFISGDVTTGAGKATTSGAPEVGLLVVLYDASNNPVQLAYTNASGAYSFNNVPVGTYRIHPEAMNYTSSDYATVTVTSSTPTVAGRNFIKYNTARTIIPVPAGVTNVNGANDASVYPNPAQNVVNINYNGAATVVVTDVAGRQVINTNINGNAAINVSDLQSGHYIMSIKGDAINMTKMIEIAK